uniref:hypothetical protein n=1 Tax=Prevotella sp. TaxID=59823 RepID=UPI003FF01D0D
MTNEVFSLISLTMLGHAKKTTDTIFTCTLEIIQYALKGQKFLGGCVKTLLFLKNHKALTFT